MRMICVMHQYMYRVIAVHTTMSLKLYLDQLPYRDDAEADPQYQYPVPSSLISFAICAIVADSVASSVAVSAKARGAREWASLKLNPNIQISACEYGT